MTTDDAKPSLESGHAPSGACGPEETGTTAPERLAIGFLVGFFGFLIGLLMWWSLSTVPELDFGWRAYLYLSCALGMASFLYGLWRPNATIERLGVIGEKIWSFSSQVLGWFGFLR